MRSTISVGSGSVNSRRKLSSECRIGTGRPRSSSDSAWNRSGRRRFAPARNRHACLLRVSRESPIGRAPRVRRRRTSAAHSSSSSRLRTRASEPCDCCAASSLASSKPAFQQPRGRIERRGHERGIDVIGVPAAAQPALAVAPLPRRAPGLVANQVLEARTAGERGRALDQPERLRASAVARSTPPGERVARNSARARAPRGSSSSQRAASGASRKSSSTMP